MPIYGNNKFFSITNHITRDMPIAPVLLYFNFIYKQYYTNILLKNKLFNKLHDNTFYKHYLAKKKLQRILKYL